MKTPAKPKDIEEPASEKVEEPAPKTKKGKTPVKAKAKIVEEEAPKEAEETPVSKPKKARTPAKAKATEDAPQVAAEKTPASKSKKEKTPSKPAVVESTPSKESEQSTPKTKKEKTPAKASQTPKATPATPKGPAQETPAKKQAKKSKSVKKADAEPEPVPEIETKAVEQDAEEAVVAQEEDNISIEEEVDEQTQALVQTVDAGDDDEPESGVVLFEQGQDVGKIPEVSKKEKKRAKKALGASKEKEEPGVIYIGRLPHGFYEYEMKSYFSQFGPIRNLRVSRNKKTGKAKHYAFVEFEEASTAEIVAKTMDVSNRHSLEHSSLQLTNSRTTCFLVTSSNVV